MNKVNTPHLHQLNDINARSFGSAADVYDAARPSYPPEALAWAFGIKPADIVDLGAGTGILTRGLIAAGHKVTAVEPDDKMMTKLLRSTQGLAGHHIGVAEELPLPDNSVDAVAAGQSYHWFDAQTVLPEIKRILRPGGTFTPIWNVRDETVDWVKKLSQIVGASDAEVTAMHALRPGYFGPHFRDVESQLFHHEKQFNAQGLLRLVQSRSYYITASDSRKRHIEAAVDRLVSTHSDLAGRDTFAMPYVTHAFRMAK